MTIGVMIKAIIAINVMATFDKPEILMGTFSLVDVVEAIKKIKRPINAPPKKPDLKTIHF